MKDYFDELTKSLDRVYKTAQAEIYLSAIADKIAWCYKWKKITKEEKIFFAIKL